LPAILDEGSVLSDEPGDGHDGALVPVGEPEQEALVVIIGHHRPERVDESSQVSSPSRVVRAAGESVPRPRG
jgi:hypothetical protein